MIAARHQSVTNLEGQLEPLAEQQQDRGVGEMEQGQPPPARRTGGGGAGRASLRRADAPAAANTSPRARSWSIAFAGIARRHRGQGGEQRDQVEHGLVVKAQPARPAAAAAKMLPARSQAALRPRRPPVQPAVRPTVIAATVGANTAPSTAMRCRPRARPAWWAPRRSPWRRPPNAHTPPISSARLCRSRR